MNLIRGLLFDNLGLKLVALLLAVVVYLNVYTDRPGVCRRYSCANDTRIWKDFDNMVLNEDWIRGNLSARGHIAIRSLPLMEVREGGEPV